MSRRKVPDVTREELLEAADLLLTMEDEMAERPAKGSSAHGRDPRPTENELLASRIQATLALVGLLEELRALVMDAREALRQEQHRR